MNPIIEGIAVVLISVLCGILYRMGGSGNYSRWVRPVGCSACLIVALSILGLLHWSLILCFGLQYGAVTTYFKKKGTEAKWWNWLLVGIATSAAILPIIIFNHEWVQFAIRSFALTLLTVLWSEFNGNAVVEEFGRGALIILTLLAFIKKERKK